METHTLTAPDAQKVGQRRESGQSTVSSASTSPTRLARVHSQTAVPLLYPVPPLSEMQGVGRYRRSINATEEFVDSNNNRNDSYADLLIAGDKRIRATSGEWSRTGRNGGNMDTTSPPPPRSAFCSRASSPVRMALYGDDQHLVGEEELEEVNGKLLFGRRKSKGSTNNGSQTTNPSSKNGSDESEGGAATTSGEAVMTTADIIAAVAKEKAATGGVGGAAAAGPFAKRRLPLGPHIARDDDNVRGRKKLSEVKNLSNNLCLKKEQTKTFLVTSENLEEAAIETDDEDVEEVESFSDTKGATMLVKATKGGAATEKERTKKGLEGPKRGRKQFRGPGQTIGVTGGMNTGARGAGQRRPPVTNRMGAGCNGGVGGKRATQNEKLQLLHMETLDEGKDLMGVH